jgi:hypothetical protein
MFQAKRIAFYLDTIWAITASEYVSQYVIGYTSSQLWRRYSGYRALGYEHIAILEDKMTRDDALLLEEKLQFAIKKDKRHTIYRKYDKDRRDKRYFRSAGQATTHPKKPVHSVYIAWWEPDG